MAPVPTIATRMSRTSSKVSKLNLCGSIVLTYVGVLIWHTPAGRSYVTTPTVYQA